MRFKSHDLHPGVFCCDLFSMTPGVPNVSMWAKSHAFEDEANLFPITPGFKSDGWVDIVADVSCLHRLIVVDTLADFFKVPVEEVTLLCE